MINSDTVVAGVPSKRLSQLASPQILPRHRRECPIADHSALKDGITDVMRPNIDYSNEKSRNPTPRPAESEGFAGKSTCRINDSIYNHGSKKKSPNANKSAQMTDLFSSAGLRPEVPYRGTRSLKQYFSPDQLSEAFCTKFHVTDPLSGRTEIMTARRPGRASAEVNVADFDAYVLRQERAHSIKKAKDSIDHTVLGLMPKPNKDIKFCLGHTTRHVQVPTLECKENWMTPTADANVCKPLGRSKRRSMFPWTPVPTNNLAHKSYGPEGAPSSLTRQSIRPAVVHP